MLIKCLKISPECRLALHWMDPLRTQKSPVLCVKISSNAENTRYVNFVPHPIFYFLKMTLFIVI